MGEVSVEPSMEEILSSIKRIIAEEGEGVPPRRRPQRTAPLPSPVDLLGDDEDDDDHVLELSDPMPEIDRLPEPAPMPKPVPAARAVRDPAPAAAAPVATTTPAAPAAAAPATAPIVSQQTAAASRGALDMLSRMMVKPESDSDGTLEGLVREMLRPMLSEWLDANLPALVETMVAREIERITSPQG
ncbi:DUF2497 domain-containing protein [Sphingomonas sp. CROZ-RG-20F-R02-07]|uniref:DUF2497 domain-containing protein n=1 Tax=Sphingomonas sp. CROZ-RG-20F-R02-07 TaxID=2914832 RepID=UPI001F58C424|nr:DUF2497 domain-containing protein [Sphingomonas sp. CROZ-RG-20F-R02-07]